MTVCGVEGCEQTYRVNHRHPDDFEILTCQACYYRLRRERNGPKKRPGKRVSETHCINGHLITPETVTYRKRPGRGYLHDTIRICKICERSSQRKSHYGMSNDELRLVLAHQGDRCPICYKNLAFEKAQVDHDHLTGRVRGLLCISCNTALGRFSDSPEVLTRALKYLTDV